MSRKERDQSKVFDRLKRKELGQKEAAEALSMSSRQVRNKFSRYLAEGDEGLVHRSRGRPSSRRWDPAQRAKALEIVFEKYHDFGPTFASEKLAEKHKIKISPETLRKAMIDHGLWSKTRKHKSHRKKRERMPSEGMMVQLDGSYHKWFEDRGPECALLVFVDDATCKIQRLEFVDSESTKSIMSSMKKYLEKHGRPVSFYVDHHAVYSVNLNNPEKEKTTQVGRALKQLGINLILAHSPQAKGRVERMNATLQDRLVKELRLENISTMDEANEFVEKCFIPNFNEKFEKKPKDNLNLHRSVEGYDLNEIFSVQDQRTLQNDYTIRYNNRCLQLEKGQPAVIRPKHKIAVHEHLNGSLSLKVRGFNLNFKEIKNALANRKPSPVEHVWKEFKCARLDEKIQPSRRPQATSPGA